MTSSLTPEQRRTVREAARRFRRRLVQLREGFQLEGVRHSLQELFDRSSAQKQIAFDHLNDNEQALLLLALEETVIGMLTSELEEIDRDQHDASCN